MLNAAGIDNSGVVGKKVVAGDNNVAVALENIAYLQAESNVTVVYPVAVCGEP